MAYHSPRAQVNGKGRFQCVFFTSGNPLHERGAAGCDPSLEPRDYHRPLPGASGVCDTGRKGRSHGGRRRLPPAGPYESTRGEGRGAVPA